MIESTATQKANLGGALLDQRDPDWFLRIDKNELVKKGVSNLLEQLWPGEQDGAVVLNLDTDQLIAHGLRVQQIPIDAIENRDVLLVLAWILTIAAREKVYEPEPAA